MQQQQQGGAQQRVLRLLVTISQDNVDRGLLQHSWLLSSPVHKVTVAVVRGRRVGEQCFCVAVTAHVFCV